jgi:hypothetical protein
MNFWEARLEALKGKKVRKKEKLAVLSASDFQSNYTWRNKDIDAEWEIVEEPKSITRYINVYDHNGVAWATHTTKHWADDNAYSEDRLSCLEIITDKNGKLISAKNV